jgi:hypothetical protein
MKANRIQRHSIRRWSAVAALAATAAVFSAGTAGADASDVLGPVTDTATLAAPLAAASSSADYFPASIPYTADPSNIFAPVYQIEPIGAPDVSPVTPAGGGVEGTQEFGVYSLGFPVETFTGQFNYSLIDNPAFIFGNPYGDAILATDTSGTSVVPDGQGFLLDEFGFGYGNVLETSENATNTAYNVGDFILTPYGDYNISPLVDFLDSSAFTGLLTGLTS